MDNSKNSILNDIVEICKISSEDEANARLKDGWVLLATYTTTYDPTVRAEHQTLFFALGRPKNVPLFNMDKFNGITEKDGRRFDKYGCELL